MFNVIFLIVRSIYSPNASWDGFGQGLLGDGFGQGLLGNGLCLFFQFFDFPSAPLNFFYLSNRLSLLHPLLANLAKVSSLLPSSPDLFRRG